MKRNVTVAVGAMCLAAAGWAVGAYAQDREPTPRPETGRTTTPRQQPGGGGGASAQAGSEICPVGIQGLAVEAMTIPAGAALQFTVAPAQVSELRNRLQRFSRMHQQQRAGGSAAMGSSPRGGATGGGATGGSDGAGGSAGAGGSMEPGGTGQQPQFAGPQALIHQARDVRVVEIPNGARLEVRMTRERLEDLRNEMHQNAQQLTEGRCPLSLQIES